MLVRLSHHDAKIYEMISKTFFTLIVYRVNLAVTKAYCRFNAIFPFIMVFLLVTSPYVKYSCFMYYYINNVWLALFA